LFHVDFIISAPPAAYKLIVSTPTTTLTMRVSHRPNSTVFTLVVVLCWVSPIEAGARSSRLSLPNIIHGISRNGHAALTRSIPALSLYKGSATSPKTIEAAVKTTSRKTKERQRKHLISLPPLSLPPIKDGGFYYGISPRNLYRQATKPQGKRPLSVQASMMEALEELREMRQEMVSMRKEMQAMKKKLIAGDGDLDEEDALERLTLHKRKRKKEFAKLGGEIERWAQQILTETEDDGWTNVACNKMMRGTLNGSGRTTCYLKVRSKMEIFAAVPMMMIMCVSS
jgi:hypothetical protein